MTCPILCGMTPLARIRDRLPHKHASLSKPDVGELLICGRRRPRFHFRPDGSELWLCITEDEFRAVAACTSVDQAVVAVGAEDVLL